MRRRRRPSRAFDGGSCGRSVAAAQACARSGRLPLVPRVAERAVAIADVGRRRACAHTVRERAAARDDELVVPDGQLLGRPRQQRHQPPESGLPACRRCRYEVADGVAREVAIDLLVITEQREDGRARPARRHRGKCPLRPAHDQEVVVNQRGVRHGRSLSRSPRLVCPRPSMCTFPKTLTLEPSRIHLCRKSWGVEHRSVLLLENRSVTVADETQDVGVTTR